MSAVGRKRISDAARKRWVAFRAKKAEDQTAKNALARSSMRNTKAGTRGSTPSGTGGERVARRYCSHVPRNLPPPT